jgi:hypothetical protein
MSKRVVAAIAAGLVIFVIPVVANPTPEWTAYAMTAAGIGVAAFFGGITASSPRAAFRFGATVTLSVSGALALLENRGHARRRRPRSRVRRPIVGICPRIGAAHRRGLLGSRRAALGRAASTSSRCFRVLPRVRLHPHRPHHLPRVRLTR